VPDEDEDAKKSKSRSAVPKTRNVIPENANVTHLTVKELNLRLRRLAHQSISDLIDPARYESNLPYFLFSTLITLSVQNIYIRYVIKCCTWIWFE
jgi:hypothetical protein